MTELASAATSFRDTPSPVDFARRLADRAASYDGNGFYVPDGELDVDAALNADDDDEEDHVHGNNDDDEMLSPVGGGASTLLPPTDSSRRNEYDSRGGEGDSSAEEDEDDNDEDDSERHERKALIGRGAPGNPPKGCFGVLARPGVMLALLCMLSLCNYYDRGAFSGLVVTLKEEFELDNTQAGLISGAFTVGYAFASPVMAQAAHRIPSGILLMAGMLVWVLSTAACAYAIDFWYLMVARCFTGIGEAAFICLSPALIDDRAPPAQRGRWLAVFYSMLPIGYSLGYLGSGLFISSIGWRWLFFSEALIALPFVCLCIFLPNVRLTNSTDDGHGAATGHESDGSAPDKEENKTLWQSLRLLAVNTTYMLMTLGYCAQTFVLGALTYWLPSYVNEVFGLDEATANYIIGGTTAFCGIVGNVLAAFIMDYFVEQRKFDRTMVGVHLAVFFSWAALPFGIVGVLVHNLTAFLILVTAAEFLILCTVTPVNVVFLSVVTDDLRGHSVAMSTLAIHIFGDMWSPYVYGAIADAAGSQEPALLFLTCWLGWVLLFWTLGGYLIGRKQKRMYARI